MKPLPMNYARFSKIMEAIRTDNPRLRQCARADGTRKDAYRRQHHAQQVVDRMNRESGATVRPGYELTAYECAICGNWHVGSTPKRT